MKTLFLQAPSYDGFDGGAGSRYQAKREIRSFWYPTWLAQPAALVPDSRVLDAPADGLSVDASLDIAQQYELVIIHTSTPSFPTDAMFAQDLKQRNPSVMVGMVGAKVAVDPHNSLTASEAIDFVCREEFDFTCQEVAAGRPQDRELLHRLPEASLRVDLHGPRLPLEVHVLPVAADRGRAPLPHALGGERAGRGAVDPRQHA